MTCVFDVHIHMSALSRKIYFCMQPGIHSNDKMNNYVSTKFNDISRYMYIIIMCTQLAKI